MASKPIRCYNCGHIGHIKKRCPEICCLQCKKSGHIRKVCPQKNTPGKSPQKLASCKSPQSSTVKKQNFESPTSSRSSVCTVTAFFQRHPNFERQSHLLYHHMYRRVSLSSSSSQTESEPVSPVLPVVSKVQNSFNRADETVKRVSETIYKLKKDSDGPFTILVNKQFQHFQENKAAGPLLIPKDKDDLQRGDWDLLILHPFFGYIHVEIKAFGDAQDEQLVEEQMKIQQLNKCLKEKVVNNLKKGWRALQYLQPHGQTVRITNALALPNVSRHFVKQVLQAEPDVLTALWECLFQDAGSPPDISTVLGFCLCSDDLPAKDGAVDEGDEHVRRAVDNWWSCVTQDARHQLSAEAYKCILACFCHHEDVMNMAESIHHTGEMFQELQLDDQQKQVIQKQNDNVFITGPPGSGKTLILAEKAVRWLLDDMTVFVIYTWGKTTNQPGSEVLLHIIEKVFSKCPSKTSDMKSLPLYKMFVSNSTRCDEFLDAILAIKENPQLGPMPKSFKRKPVDVMFEEVTQPDSLEKWFNPIALPDVKQIEKDPSAENGGKIGFIIDELSKRTGAEISIELISQINKRLPAAKIWCAGTFPTYCPGSYFQTEQLLNSHRCTPKTQRLLKALEPFCQSEKSHVFQYVTSCTRFPRSPDESGVEESFILPDDGPDPQFFSHAAHGNGEIMDCAKCAKDVLQHLNEDLHIKKDDSSEAGLHERDVLIVVTGTVLYNSMQTIEHEAFYRQLTNENSGFRVNIYKISDTFKLQTAGMSLMHSRTIAGMEKKVVIFLPCRQYQAKPITYAEAVQSQPAAIGMSASKNSKSDSEVDNSQRGIRQILERCPHITQRQTQALARLGLLNLHWMWYSVSRSVAHNIIFHF